MASTAERSAVASQADAPSADEVKRRFLEAWHTVLEDVRSNLDDEFDLPESAKEYFRHSLEYNVPHGKLNRGLAVVQSALAFAEGGGDGHRPDRDELIFRASMLGWCVELLQSFFLVADDIMDDSVTRRGQPCYYRLPHIGMKAINDGIILDNLVYMILRKYFVEDRCYTQLLELFHEVTYRTAVGQLLDLTSQKEPNDVDLESFREDTLQRIYLYKTAYYSFYLPVALGMRLVNIDDRRRDCAAQDICLEMGRYFQAQDDYIDCFGDPTVTGKVGTDIEDNKCTWPVVQALKVASEEDRRVLQDNYGRRDAEKVRRVKETYERLGVHEAFERYESDCQESLTAKIKAASADMPVGAFEFLLQKIFRRSK